MELVSDIHSDLWDDRDMIRLYPSGYPRPWVMHPDWRPQLRVVE